MNNTPIEQERRARRWIFAAMGCFAVGMGGSALPGPGFLSVLGFGGFGVCVIGAIVTGHLTHARWRRQMAAQNYAWYRGEHPELVTQGGVKCARCGGTRIHVRGLMRHSYFREHFCTQCGAALYYSAEAGT